MNKTNIMTTKSNIFYAHSGGVTAVINATACGLIEEARRHPNKLGKVYAGQYGIIGALEENLLDTSLASDAEIIQLRHTPGSAFGSCRYKLPALNDQAKEYMRIIEVFKAHDIGYFFYNGGNDSQDTACKLAHFAKTQQHPLICLGIPKTIDNDLPITDNCPGFGSVAKYVAIAIQEASLDLASMAKSSTKVFILEVMGRHAGWIAAAAGLAQQRPDQGPHLILFPERPFSLDLLKKKVKQTVEKYGFCSIVASEGIRNEKGQLLTETKTVDAFGHKQLGGVAPYLAQMISKTLTYKCHWAVSDYLQRSARHIASACDVEQSHALGKKAIQYALAGKQSVMLTLKRLDTPSYDWTIDCTALEQVANKEKLLPENFIQPDGFHITSACRDYLLPLIQGEDYPPYHQGLPDYAKLHFPLAKKYLPDFKIT